MQIEVGKSYINADWEEVSIIRRNENHDAGLYPFIGAIKKYAGKWLEAHYSDSGVCNLGGDLISECIPKECHPGQVVGVGSAEFKTVDNKTIDNGTTRQFTTGYQRDTGKGKGRFDLLGQAYYGLLEVALLFQRGAEKYGESNWLKGAPLSVYIDCMSRHAAKLAAGWTDERHDAAVAWNAICYMHTLQLIEEGKLPKELDDRRK